METQTTNGTTANATAPAKTFSKDAKARRKAFEAYAGCESAVAKAEKALEIAKASRSESVKHILETYGAGPWDFDGQRLTACRAPRGESYIMRGQNISGVEKV